MDVVESGVNNIQV